ncbi:MAG TPA: BlaI/MecI/CopY family transcriptional regulator [Gemmatimonadales bacterium]|nr:BlaI/MecI/CopY family transcriptional regulator [Gemmatimonadales bacterium]
MDFGIGDRELDVMAVLWERGSGTVAEVREQLPAELAYTTVLTILRNLEAKQFVRREDEGRAHRYFPLVQAEAAGRNVLGRVIDTMFAGRADLLLTHLVDEHPLSADELKALRKLLKRRLEDSDRKADE